MRNRIYKQLTGHRGKIRGVRDVIKSAVLSHPCLVCGKTMERILYPNGRFETQARFSVRKTCSKQCKKVFLLGEGNPHWKGGLGCCIGCGIKLSTYPSANTKAERCLKCTPAHLKEIWHKTHFTKTDKQAEV